MTALQARGCDGENNHHPPLRRKMKRTPVECLRIAAGLTQVQLATRLKTSPASYQRFEANTAALPAAMREQIARVFGVAPETLTPPTTRRGIELLGRSMVKVMAKFAPPPPKPVPAGKQPFPRNFRLK